MAVLQIGKYFTIAGVKTWRDGPGELVRVDPGNHHQYCVSYLPDWSGKLLDTQYRNFSEDELTPVNWDKVFASNKASAA